ncbi:MAG: dihydropteroate synthase [Methanomicrobiales archaeon]|nr:dihydropteroate synthase [Methanomicrobiales archaeon]MDD1668903.1 dihydropteroate synthase [Methanomicrobiales archaeon]
MRACTINGLAIGEGFPVRLMGVINCSPESFYRGSYVRPEETRAKALAMASDGADLVDVGARATGPGSPDLPVAVERERMVEALSALEGSGVTVSVDTRYPEVLEACLRYEIHAVNDIGGLSDPRFAGMVRDSGLPAILMASRSVPGDAIGLPATMETLRLVVERCREHGIRDYILDPGIGRWVPGRTAGNDWDLVRGFGEFRAFGRPLLAAVSRKTFIGELLRRGPDERLAGSLAAALLLALEGASVVRAHDVRESRDVLAVLSEVQKR